MITIGSHILVKVYHYNPLKGIQYETIPSVVEKMDQALGMVYGSASPIAGAGSSYDFYQYSDGTFCHGRKHNYAR